MKRNVLIFFFVMLIANLALAGDNVWTFCGPDSHMDVLSIAVDPVQSEIVYIAGGADGGPDAYRSTDGGTRWEPIMEVPPTCGAFPVVVDPLTLGTLYIGTPKYNTGHYLAKSTDYGESWSPADSGLVSDVTCLAINPLNPEILYAGVFAARVFKSTNGGKSWEFAGWGIENYWTRWLLIDPVCPETLYVGSDAFEPFYGEIYKSPDGAESWKLAMDGLPLDPAISNLIMDPRPPGTLYVCASSRLVPPKIYKSTDSAESWKPVSEFGCFRLAIDPIRPDTIYACYGGTVYRSTDAARNWEDFSNGLPENIEIVTLTVAPTTPVKIYAGTAYRGVWCYTDTLNGVEDNPSPDLPRQPSLSPNYPNPFNSTTVIRYRLSVAKPFHTALRIYNIRGERVRELVDKHQKGGHYEITWDGKDSSGQDVASGVYFYRLEVKGDGLKVTKSRKMVLLR